MSEYGLKKTFCGKTFTGENFASKSYFRVFYPEKCDDVIHHYLTGDNAGQTVTWQLRNGPSGDHCVTHDSKEKCAQFVIGSDRPYYSVCDGKAYYFPTNPVDGNHLDN